MVKNKKNRQDNKISNNNSSRYYRDNSKNEKIKISDAKNKKKRSKDHSDIRDRLGNKQQKPVKKSHKNNKDTQNNNLHLPDPQKYDDDQMSDDAFSYHSETFDKENMKPRNSQLNEKSNKKSNRSSRGRDSGSPVRNKSNTNKRNSGFGTFPFTKKIENDDSVNDIIGDSISLAKRRQNKPLPGKANRDEKKAKSITTTRENLKKVTINLKNNLTKSDSGSDTDDQLLMDAEPSKSKNLKFSIQKSFSASQDSDQENAENSEQNYKNLKIHIHGEKAQQKNKKSEADKKHETSRDELLKLSYKVENDLMEKKRSDKKSKDDFKKESKNDTVKPLESDLVKRPLDDKERLSARQNRFKNPPEITSVRQKPEKQRPSAREKSPEQPPKRSYDHDRDRDRSSRSKETRQKDRNSTSEKNNSSKEKRPTAKTSKRSYDNDPHPKKLGKNDNSESVKDLSIDSKKPRYGRNYDKVSNDTQEEVDFAVKLGESINNEKKNNKRKNPRSRSTSIERLERELAENQRKLEEAKLEDERQKSRKRVREESKDKKKTYRPESKYEMSDASGQSSESDSDSSSSSSEDSSSDDSDRSEDDKLDYQIQQTKLLTKSMKKYSKKYGLDYSENSGNSSLVGSHTKIEDNNNHDLPVASKKIAKLEKKLKSLRDKKSRYKAEKKLKKKEEKQKERAIKKLELKELEKLRKKQQKMDDSDSDANISDAESTASKSTEIDALADLPHPKTLANGLKLPSDITKMPIAIPDGHGSFKIVSQADFARLHSAEVLYAQNLLLQQQLAEIQSQRSNLNNTRSTIPDSKVDISSTKKSKKDKKKKNWQSLAIDEMNDDDGAENPAALETHIPEKPDKSTSESNTNKNDTYATNDFLSKYPDYKPEWNFKNSKNSSIIRPAFSGLVNCDRSKLRQLSREKFFAAENLPKFHPPPKYISPLEGNRLIISNLFISATKSLSSNSIQLPSDTQIINKLVEIGPVKDCKYDNKAGIAKITMIYRKDCKAIISKFNNRSNFCGSEGKVKIVEDRPPKDVKYYPIEDYEWKEAMPEQAERCGNANIGTLDPTVVNRAWYPDEFPTPHRANFTLKLNF